MTVGSIRAFLVALALLALARPLAALQVEILRSVGSLPPHIVGTFEEPIDFQQAKSGEYYIFDRRGHTVHTVDAARTTSKKVLEIGFEDGRVIQPSGFDLAPDGRFVVADVPRSQQRVQTFDATGRLLTGFFLPGAPSARVVLGNLMLNGAGSVQFGAETLFISHPESGALFTEYTPRGSAFRSIGRLRSTGFEDDRDLHVALNAGLPLLDPTGGYFYVFITGRPMFRKYDANGTLVFERHIEGVELDPSIQALPTTWPARATGALPLVSPLVRTAAIDAGGRLWISLMTPFTYVYDRNGDKTRTVQLEAGGDLVSPASLFFTRQGRLLVTPGCHEFAVK